jgi:LmbE family N-acetylglucosaminyl deacetylase
MIALEVPRARARRALRVLCLGAHCDDIDIGCGGTLLRLFGRSRPTEVTWVVFSAQTERERELRASAKRFLRSTARWSVVTHEFRDSYFPAQYEKIKEAFESLKSLPSPDIVFTHHRGDLHQDHRVIGELTWNAFRRHLIVEYEVPKYDGGLTTPNLYVPLEPAHVERKIRILTSCYQTQLSKPWFTADMFRGMMRLRGMEAGSVSGWAEGFHASKLCMS